ncbi:MAG: dipeptidase [Lentisphaerae bacterium]|nr:dipeptidase [Lentisphaerota bacterium]
MMDYFQKVRKAAMDVLRPDEKTLRHGLELHEESFVFDAYGFSPGGGGKCERVEKLIADGAGRNEIIRAQEEFRMCGCWENPELRRRLKEAWDFSGVNCNFQNSGVEGNDPVEMLYRLSNYTNTVDRLTDIYERAVYPHQLPGIKERGHRAIYMTTNGVPLPDYKVSTDEALNLIGVFFRLGVRMMHLTYNRRNLLGDGCAEAADAGLSAFGKDVIAEMNRVGMLVDVAHSGQKTSYDAAKASVKPMVASHSAAGALSTHYRAKNDEVIQAVKETGGYVGICGHPPFLQGSMDLNAMLDHIEYIARKFGVDHVAIGTDNGVGLCPEEKYIATPKMRPIWEQYWTAPGAGYELMTKEQYDSVNWLNWPMYTVGLVQRGFTDDEIRKIIGGNVMRVITEILEK